MGNITELELTLTVSIILEQAGKGKVLAPEETAMVRLYLEWCVLPGTPLRAAMLGLLESYESLRTEKLLIQLLPTE